MLVQAIDEDGTAALTVDNLKSVLSSMGESYTDEQIEAAIAQADFDNDGVVSLDDFCKLAAAVQS